MNVEQVSVSSPLWGSTETENRVHKYNVALFTLYFKEAMSSQRLNPTCINAVPTNAASSTCSNVDQEFWGKFGEDMMNQAYGLFRLSCETTIFESYPLFRTKRTIPSHALRDINGVLSAVDHEGPPVYLVPIIPTSTASTTRELHVLDHALYDILRSKVQMNDNAQYYSTNDSGAFTKLTLALILQYTQPLPQLSTDSAARAPHALTHRILSPAALRKCALEALPPAKQPLHPPVALAHAAAAHTASTSVAGRIHLAAAQPCPHTSACMIIGRDNSPATPETPPQPSAASLAPASTLLARASLLLAAQGHGSPADAILARHKLNTPAATATDALAAATAPADADAPASPLSLLLLAADHPVHTQHTSAPASLAAPTLGDLACSQDATDTAFLQTGVTAKTSASASARAGVGAAVSAAVQSIVEESLGPLAPQFTNRVNGVIGSVLQNQFTYSLVPGITESITKDLARMIPAHMKVTVPTAIAEIVKDQLPPIVAKHVGQRVTWTVANQLTQDVVDHVTGPVAEITIRKLALTIPGKVAYLTNRQLTPMLTKSLTHSIVPAISYTLEKSPLRVSWCEACRDHNKLCEYCWQNPTNIHNGFYYAGYYSTYYADYYNRYFDGELKEKRRAARRKEKEIELIHNRYETILDVEAKDEGSAGDAGDSE